MTNRTTEVARLSWGEVCAKRLDRHALSTPMQDARLADIVGTICGAHAQVLSAAELSIGLRLAGITRTEIREALWTERSLVKTFGPRGICPCGSGRCPRFRLLALVRQKTCD